MGSDAKLCLRQPPFGPLGCWRCGYDNVIIKMQISGNLGRCGGNDKPSPRLGKV